MFFLIVEISSWLINTTILSIVVFIIVSLLSKMSTICNKIEMSAPFRQKPLILFRSFVVLLFVSYVLEWMLFFMIMICLYISHRHFFFHYLHRNYLNNFYSTNFCKKQLIFFNKTFNHYVTHGILNDRSAHYDAIHYPQAHCTNPT